MNLKRLMVNLGIIITGIYIVDFLCEDHPVAALGMTLACAVLLSCKSSHEADLP